MRRVVVTCLCLGALLILPSHAFATGVPQRLAALEAALASLQTENQSLRDQVVHLQTETRTLQTAVLSLQTENQSLRNQVTSLQTSLAALETGVQAINDSPVMALNPYVGVTHDGRGPLVRLTGVNLQIVNGLNSTGTINGLGNLIVGYDETAPEGSARNCSDFFPPPPDDQPCVARKSGSHNLVTGSYNGYAEYGGLVAGWRNTLSGPYASVTGGAHNVAGYSRDPLPGGGGGFPYASVTGGANNRAEGYFSSITGGANNFARGYLSSISGGISNTTDGDGGSSVCGGERNFARTDSSTVCGGIENVAWTVGSTVAGGYANRAEGYASSVSGGYHNSTGASYSSVSGGKDRTATAEYNWVAGSLVEPY
jgi:FtsZ-binding cell division protein ZapB